MIGKKHKKNRIIWIQDGKNDGSICDKTFGRKDNKAIWWKDIDNKA